MRRSALFAILLLAACQQAEAPPPEPTPTAEPQPLTDLAGSYEVVDVDDRGFDPPNAVIMHIDGERIDFANCQRIGWAYTLEEGKLETERSPPPGEPCPDKLHVRVLQMVSAIDAAEEGVRTADGRVTLTGDLRTVTLEPR